MIPNFYYILFKLESWFCVFRKVLAKMQKAFSSDVIQQKC